jgi:uncharacterized membrane protein YczE
MIAYSVEGIVCVLCAMFLESDISIGFVLAAAVISFIMAVYSIFAKRHYEITRKQLQEVEELYNQMVGKN